MPAKRKPRTKPTRGGATSKAAAVRKPDPAAVELPAPVELPGTGDEGGARPAASKTGPPPRNRGGFTGIGRAQGAAPTRQYAFRRS